MKQTKLLVATLGLVLGATVISAQVIPEKKFTVSYSNSIYTPLDPTRAVEIFGSSTVDVFDIETPINTNILFDYCGTEMNTFHITESGGIIVNDIMATSEDYNIGNILGFFLPEMYPSLLSSMILMDTMTVDDHSVFIYEIKDFSIVKDSFLFNYQIWLHEGSNAIEIRMGNHNIPEGTFSSFEIDPDDSSVYLDKIVYAGLIYNNGPVLSEAYEDMNIHLASPLLKDSLFSMYATGEVFDEYGDSAMVAILGDYLYTTFPVSGTVIRYTPIVAEDTSSSIYSHLQLQASVAPNPSANGVFNIQLTDASQNVNVILMDINGRVLLKEEKRNYQLNLDISNQPRGTYFLQLMSGDKQTVLKLVKS